MTLFAGARLSAKRVGAHDRLFYSAIAVAMALAVFAGFARTYYLPLLSGGTMVTIAGLPFAPVVHIHGALFTSWVLLFILQTTLAPTERPRFPDANRDARHDHRGREQGAGSSESAMDGCWAERRWQASSLARACCPPGDLRLRPNDP